MTNFKLGITIDGESAKKLLAVGPNDLKDYFLPEFLDIDPKDVVAIKFIEDIPPERYFFEKKIVHKDNYFRDKFEEEAE